MTDILAVQNWKSNAEMILDVHRLGYLRDTDKVLDPTYGLGAWWKLWRPANELLVTSDIDPTKGDYTGDFRLLMWPDGYFDAVAFDPPYKLNGTPSEPDARYGVDVVASREDRHQLIRDGLTECALVLKPKVILLLKCQDQVNGGKVRWQTHLFTAHAETLGLELIDALHMLGGRAQPAGRRQVHARRNHSTLLVFKKKREQINDQGSLL